MLHYGVFLEGLSPDNEKKLALILFQSLVKILDVYSKKSKFSCEDKKICKQRKIFFYYNEGTRLIISERAEECKEALVKAIQASEFSVEVIDVFKKLKFFASEEEALIYSRNGLLYSKRPRTHKNNNIKIIASFNGAVTSIFGVDQILSRNSGLIFAHRHNDCSSYDGLCDLLPSFKQSGVSMIYVELPCDSFSSLFAVFNKSTNIDLAPIWKTLEAEKQKQSILYNKEKNKAYCKFFLAAKKAGISIYPCDVSSIHFKTHASGKEVLDYKRRTEIGDACMIRSIEKFQADHKQPKFIALVGLAHANVAKELNTPFCFIGDTQKIFFIENKKQFFLECLMSRVDYLCDAKQGMVMRMNASTLSYPSFASSPISIDQKEDPVIKKLLLNWDNLTQKIPYFSSVIADEANKAKEIYIEFSLTKQQDNRSNISDTCTSLHQFLVAKLTRSVYPKNAELLHPKNWLSLFRCRRPYGIRLSENEPAAFTLTNLYDANITGSHPVKRHHA